MFANWQAFMVGKTISHRRFPNELGSTLIGRLLGVLLVLAMPLVPATGADSSEQVFDNIALEVEQRLRSLRNFTCALTVERSWKTRKHKRLRRLDKVQAEIAYIDGAEMFANPGEQQFEARLPESLASSGMFSTGSFAQTLQNVFLTGEATFQYRGEETIDGSNCHRYDFTVSAASDLQRLNFNGTSTSVGFHGTVWAAAESLAILRTQLIIDEAPRSTGLTSADEIVDYEPVKIGIEYSLLPIRSSMTIIMRDGSERHNRSRYTDCRQYRGESTIAFLQEGDVIPLGERDAVVGTAPRTRKLSIPRGVRFGLRLDTKLDSDSLVTGVAVKATLCSDIKHAGRIIVPEGATALGRVVQFQPYARPNAYVVWVEFQSLGFGEVQALVDARLMGFGSLSPPGTSLTTDPNNTQPGARPSEGPFYVFTQTGHFSIPAGTVMLWLTK